MLAWLIGVLMVLTMMPAFAFGDAADEDAVELPASEEVAAPEAEDATEAITGEAEDAIVPLAASEEGFAPEAVPYFQVYTQTGTDLSTKKLVSVYSLSELQGLAAIDSSAFGPLGYLWRGHGSGGWDVYASDNYVLLSTLFADAGISFRAGDQVSFLASDGFGRTYGYQDINNANGFYPATVDNTNDTGGAYTVPPIIALTAGTAVANPNAQAAIATAIADPEAYTNRLLLGVTAANYEAKTAAGNRFPRDVNQVIVITPPPISAFKISVKNGDSDPVVVKNFTGPELQALVPENAGSTPLGFLQAAGSAWNVHTSSKYIPLTTLLNAAGVTFNQGDVLRPQASDGFGTNFTYDAIQAGQYFYPATGPLAANVDTAGVIQTGAVLALDYNSAPITTNAAAALVASNAGQQFTTGRFFIGLSEANYLTATAPGNRFVTGPNEILITKPETGPGEGIFIIRTLNAFSTSKAVDIYANSTANSAKVEIWENNTTSAQRFSLTKDAGGYYTITNVNSGKVLDVSGNAIKSGTAIIQYTDRGADNQKWAITKNADDSFTIASKANPDLVLDVEGAQAKNGAAILLYTNRSAANQKFVFQKITPVLTSGGTFTIAASYTPLVLDVAGALTANGSNVALWTANGKDNQKFKFDYDAATGYYTITGVHSKKALDVEASSSNVLIWADHNGFNQKWTVIQTGPDMYRLYSAASGKALDAAGAGTKAGTNVTVWTSNGGANQLWTIS
jgi:hypothetical protein